MEESGTKGSSKEQINLYFKAALKALEEEKGDFDEDIESNDTSNALCWSIEAMFLHGMKNSKPNKDFWPIIKKFSHKSSLETIKSFNQIRSDVGRCRSWLRLSINECCLESYMSIIISDLSLMSRHYHLNAFLLDDEIVNSVMPSIKGLSSHQFKLSCNSTVLNQWNIPPLQLAGIISNKTIKWPQARKVKKPCNGPGSAISLARSTSGSTPPSVTKLPFLPHPPQNLVASNGHLNRHSGLGKAQCQSAENLCSQYSTGGVYAMSASIPSSLEKDTLSVSSSVSRPDFGDARQDFYRTVYDISESEEEDVSKSTVRRSFEDDDTRFKLIVQHNLDKYPLNYDRILSSSQEAEEQLSRHLALGLPLPVNSSPTGFRDIDCLHLNEHKTQETPAVVASKIGNSSKQEIKNYLPTNGEVNEIERKCITMTAIPKISIENLNENVDNDVQINFWEEDEYSLGDGGMITVDKIIESVVGKKSIIREDANKKDTLKSKRHCLHEASKKDLDIAEEYTSIKQEKGLSSQCFQCKTCSAPIGVFFGKERVCSFDKCYYCPECLDKEEEVIPCKVIFNWDFRPYKVSRSSHKYLSMYKATPLINIEDLNPSLYSHVPALNGVKMARLKLKYLKAYLLNCNLNHVISLHSFLGDLPYYTENIHTYSMEDLLRVPSGHLLKTMNRACQFGVDHVLSCHLCSQKGFYCEICRAGGIIYPFDLENTVRCDSCKAVYHKNCKTSGRACPKCQRKARRNSSCSEMKSSELESDASQCPQNFVNYSYTAAIV